MTDVREEAPHRVVTLVRSGLLPMELGIIHRLFGTAVGDDGRPLYSVVTCAPEPGELATEVDVDPDVLYTDDRGVLTSAGVAAGIDLCLHMIRSDHGAGVANTVARRTVVPPHREGGQAQYIERPVPEPGASSTATARAYALDHLMEPLALKDLAREASMSVRTLSRRFVLETGTTPMRWLAEQRLQHARRLLEATDEPVDRIAAQAGFGTGTAMRQRFRESLGVSPRAYRHTFRGTN